MLLAYRHAPEILQPYLFGSECLIRSGLLGFRRLRPLSFRHDKKVQGKTDSSYTGKS